MLLFALLKPLRSRHTLVCTLSVAALTSVSAQTITANEATSGKVVVSGVVPDDATRNAVMAQMRALYNADRVVDQLGISPLSTPVNWLPNIQKALSPELKKVRNGQMRIAGTFIDISGEVVSEAARKQLLDHLTAQINNPTYTIRDTLRITGDGQQALDEILAKQIVEFETGNAIIAPAGLTVLDQLLPHLQRMTGRRFEVIGHTDDVGSRNSNLRLSQARADAVKAYLVKKGIPAADIGTSGAGPDLPVASNQTPEGRARNRRIQLRVLA